MDVDRRVEMHDRLPKARYFGVVIDAAKRGLAHWRPLVPERPDAVLAGFSVACGRVFVKYLHDVAAEIATFDLDGKPLGRIALPELGDAGAPAGEWGGREAYYTFV